ncbi:MAG: DEAD/DEAH box helicase [Lachnospiraceae bacterium]|nr:DEAD/DEAH box helicase [Lachnospiraceae bacterium]
MSENDLSVYPISVRELVEFVLREGDIDDRMGGSVEQAMLEGARIHRMIQGSQKGDYHAEVPLVCTVPMGEYALVIRGRADGVIEREKEESAGVQLSLSDLLPGGKNEEDDAYADAPVIDEIKAVSMELRGVREPKNVHLAQAMCYALFYARDHGLARIKVRITYCHRKTMELKFFRFRYTVSELETWFTGLIEKFRRFSDLDFTHQKECRASIAKITFPFAYRAGQKALAGYVWRTIEEGKKLFLEAPTGSGKTLAALYPALKAIGEGRADRLFYMTAKTIARTAPEQAIRLLTDRGLVFRSLTLTAKDKICVLEQASCNPVDCPRAKGHYDRVSDALYELLTAPGQPDREKISEIAAKHSVCPFELSLDASLFSDGIICDYNYVFDPFVQLGRFFAGEEKKPVILLADEAHNLLDRGRKMYSAEFSCEAVREAGASFTALLKEEDHLPDQDRKLLRGVIAKTRSVASVMEETLRGVPDGKLQLLESIDPLIDACASLHGAITELLDAQRSLFDPEELRFWFDLGRFLVIADLTDDHFLICGEKDPQGHGAVSLMCVDPSACLAEQMDRAVSTILFSATFLPIQYYKGLLGGTPEDYEAYAETSFSRDQYLVLIADDVTTRLKDRGPEQYRRIACYLHEMVCAKTGKYMAFFPSYQLLREVLGAYLEAFGEEETADLVVQQERMTEEGREEFLNWFTNGTSADLQDRVAIPIETEEERSTLGLCVLGGIFGEGIDLTGERLIGVAVVGTGLPMVTPRRDLLRDYFAQRGRDGFDYAYRYPGMNHVLQAAGRLIRTENDAGVILLLDHRFLNSEEQRLFPKEWKERITTTTDSVKNALNSFWKEHL